MLRKTLSCFTLPLLLLLSINSGNSAPLPVQSAPEGFNPGPDIITGDVGEIGGLEQFGTSGSQVGLGVSTTSCNIGNQSVGFFAMPDTHHPIIPHNLYRMSGGPGNNDRFEQIGQSWAKHAFGADEASVCSVCTTGGAPFHLGVGCSDTYANFQNATQDDLGSRALINPFTGIFQSTARDHTGHVHTGTSHRILVEGSDLNTTLNPGATYYAEVQYISSDEYAWCQTHPGQCNMYNNASYRRYDVTGTTNFTFSEVGPAVRMMAAVNAWTGATINPIEPEPGVDGRAFIAYKVTGPVAGVWHYEYALYNENLDRGIQSFSVPLGCGITLSNLGFHAPLNHPGFANDGTVGGAGFSNAAWASNQTTAAVSWSSETFAQNQNANAIRWGTLYNFRFDSNKPPIATNATIGFFKTGAPVTVGILGPNACDVAPTPTPTATPCGGIIYSQNFDGVIAPALPVGWVPCPPSGNAIQWATSTILPDTPPNCLFVDNQEGVSDRCVVAGEDPLVIIITSPTAQLSFRNNYNTEYSPPLNQVFYDGGVLEISSTNYNGGLFTDVTDPGLGCSFVTGGYTGIIDSFSGNPLAGRPAWSGNSGGYINTVVNLGPIVNGQRIRIRFRMGTDSVGSAPGWRVDNFSIVDGLCSTPTPSPTVPPGGTPTPTPTATAAPTATPTATPSPTATVTPTPAAQPLNFSTRMLVQTGDNVGIGGFIITGSVPKHVVVRAIGPSTVPGALVDPVLELHGPPGFVTIINDNCADGQIPPPPPFCQPGGLDAGIEATLAPGPYTAIVRGKNNTTGVALVEVYDVNQAANSKLANISTRAFVSTADNIVIAGFILGGNSGPDRILVRGIGPSLTGFGVPNALADPTLELRDSNGALLDSNNNWQDNPIMPVLPPGLQPTNPLESVIVDTLPPGLYTALLAGVNNGTGVGLVEVYDLGAP